MKKILFHIVLVVYILCGKSLYSQSFSIYSVYKYGATLSKEQYKKIHTAEWHKQEAHILKDKINQNERQIKIEQRNNTGGENKKIQKLASKNEELLSKSLNHFKESNQSFYTVYKEKIDVLWEKYESDDEALVIIKAMENNGIQLFENAKEIRNKINKEDNLETVNKQNEEACNLEKKGLEMISSALEGYYNYELELKRKKEQDSIYATNENSDSETSSGNHIPDEITPEIVSYDPTMNVEMDDKTVTYETKKDKLDEDLSQMIVITKDAPIIYRDDEEILELIFNNYDLDNIDEEIVITKQELRTLQKKRQEKLSEQKDLANQKIQNDTIRENEKVNLNTLEETDDDLNYKLADTDTKNDLPEENYTFTDTEVAQEISDKNDISSVNNDLDDNNVPDQNISDNKKRKEESTETYVRDDNNNSINIPIITPPVSSGIIAANTPVSHLNASSVNESTGQEKMEKSYKSSDNIKEDNQGIQTDELLQKKESEITSTNEYSTEIQNNENLEKNSNPEYDEPGTTGTDVSVKNTISSSDQISNEVLSEIDVDNNTIITENETDVVPENKNIYKPKGVEVSEKSTISLSIETSDILGKDILSKSNNIIKQDEIVSSTEDQNTIEENDIEFISESIGKNQKTEPTKINAYNNDIKGADAQEITNINSNQALNTEIPNGLKNRNEKMQDDIIHFRVQIAASRSPMTKDELNRKYKGNNEITMFQEEGWYKYIIGEYADYYEAKSVMKKSGVFDVFIAAYQLDKKLVLYKAIRQSRE